MNATDRALLLELLRWQRNLRVWTVDYHGASRTYRRVAAGIGVDIWDSPNGWRIRIYRAERALMWRQFTPWMPVTSVQQAADLLAAYDIIPARFSTAARAAATEIAFLAGRIADAHDRTWHLQQALAAAESPAGAL